MLHVGALLPFGRPHVGLTGSDLTSVERWIALRDRLVVPLGELARRVQYLLDELCTDFGFCLPPVDQDRLRTEPPLDPDAFTDAVFEAEGLDPQLNRQLRRPIKERVMNRMPDIIDAYRWDGP